MIKQKYKLDLHSHSIISYDGGITPQNYEKLLSQKTIDYIAITDHNETKLALQLHQKLGERIIVGEEITTTEGEIIGLFLEKTVPRGISLTDAIIQIKAQNGLVYIPHPFETFRQGIQTNTIETIKKDIDIIEIFNSRALFRGKPQQALEFAQKNQIAMAASSDAHIRFGVGSAYSYIDEIPTQKSLTKILKNAKYKKENAQILSLAFPSINKIRKQLGI